MPCAFFFPKRPLSIPTAAIYTNDFAVNDDGTLNLNSQWKSLSEKTTGTITSKLYEKKAPEGNNLDLYGVEVMSSKETGLQSVTSLAGYKGDTKSDRVSYVAFDAQGKVSSSTLCWDKKSCITLNDRFCGRLMVRAGAKTSKELVEKHEVCTALSMEFDEVFNEGAGLGPEILQLQGQNFKNIVNGQLSKNLMPASTKDFISRHTNGDAPRPGSTREGQVQIAEALQACAHYASTGQFRRSDSRDESAVAPARSVQ